jgi:hypothetical protein
VASVRAARSRWRRGATALGVGEAKAVRMRVKAVAAAGGSGEVGGSQGGWCGCGVGRGGAERWWVEGVLLGVKRQERRAWKSGIRRWKRPPRRARWRVKSMRVVWQRRM